jgi:hypothetical protein
MRAPRVLVPHHRCRNCGGPTRSQYEYCANTPECASLYQAVWQETYAGSSTHQACKNCGLPTTSKYGYCKRTSKCRDLREQVRWALITNGKVERRACLGCGKRLSANLTLLVALCATCDGTKTVQRKRATKAETMAAYGGVCACCGEDRLIFLSIDHINGDGAAERERLWGAKGRQRGGRGMYQYLKNNGFPDKDRYQVLCYNCNMAKRTDLTCPCSAHTYTPELPGQLVLF